MHRKHSHLPIAPARYRTVATKFPVCFPRRIGPTRETIPPPGDFPSKMRLPSHGLASCFREKVFSKRKKAFSRRTSLAGIPATECIPLQTELDVFYWIEKTDAQDPGGRSLQPASTRPQHPAQGGQKRMLRVVQQPVRAPSLPMEGVLHQLETKGNRRAHGR